MTTLYPQKALKISILAILLLLLAGLYTIQAQTVTVGTGTLTTATVPIYNSVSYSATEILYRGVTDLQSTTGNITEIAFYRASGANVNTGGITIYMKATLNTATTTTTMDLTGYTQVFSGTYNTSGTAGWKTIALSTPFPFTSSANNLSVFVVNNLGTTISTTPQWRYASLTGHTSRMVSTSAAWTSSSSMTATSTRPLTQFLFTALTPCAGAPTAGSAISSNGTVCPNANFTLGLSGNVVDGGLTYQWQSSTNNSTWNNIASATSASLTTSQTASTYYRCHVTCSNSSQITPSGSVQVVMQTDPFACYCKPTNTYGCTSDYISKVVFGTINTTNTCSGSSPTFTTGYATPNPTFTAGGSYPFTINTGNASSKEGVHVWIDFNRNNVFDASESVYSGFANVAGASYSGNIAIPVATAPGAAVMRVMAKWNAAPATIDACGSLSTGGETEDYLITIASAPDCSTSTFSGSVNATASKSAVCNTEALTFGLSATMPVALGITYQWKSSGDGVTYVNAGTASASPSASITVDANANYFKCDVLCNGSVVLTSAPVQITVHLDVTPTGAARCGTGSVTLQATTPAGNTLKWYTGPTGGTSFNIGTSYNTPSLNNSTTYYIAATNGAGESHVGPVSPSFGSLGSTNNGYGMVFATTNATELKSVNIFPVDAGDNYIQLRNSSGTVISQILVSVSAAEANSTNSFVGTPKTVTLNWNLSANTTYQLYWPQTAYNINRLLRNTSNATSYYNVDAGGVRFTGDVNGTGSSYWYYFYDMVVGQGCGEGARVPVTATINTPPAGVTATNDGTFVGTGINFTSTPNGLSSYSWSGPSGFASTLQNPTIASAATSNNGVYTVTVTNSANCSATANTTVAVVPSTYVWTGTVSTDWHVAGNWSINLVPNSSGATVVIPSNVSSNRYPNVTAIASVGALQIGENDSIVLSAPLQVYGNVSVTGTALVKITGADKFILKGNAAQSIDGKFQLNTLNVSNTSPSGVAVTANAQLEIFKALELQTGNLNVTAGAVTFRSTSETSIAVIDNFSAGFNGTLTGPVNAERYYKAPSANSYSSHYISSPINAPPVAALGASGTAGYVINNTCDETRSASNSPYGNVFAYDEAQGVDCGLEGWEVITSASGNTNNVQGYAVAKSGNGVLTLSGNANLQPTYTVGNITNTGWSNTTLQGRALHGGWYLAGNPYLAALNLQTLPNTGMDAQVQIWNTQTGSYDEYVIGVDPVIPVAPFQAFMVHKTASGGWASYTVNGADRTRSINPVFYQLGNTEILTVIAKNVTTGLNDKTRIAFDSSTTSQFDSQADANKMYGQLQNHTLYTTSQGKMMARNYLHSITETSTVPLCMYTGTTGSYEFTFDGLQSFDPTSYIYLEDLVTGAMVNVRQQLVYAFTMATGDNAERFVLHFTPAAIVNATPATCTSLGSIAVTQPGMAVWNYNITDATSNVISTGTVNQATPLNIACATGMYTLTLTDSNGYSVARMIDISGPDSAQSVFTVSSTTVGQNETLTVTATAPGAVSYLWDFGNGITATGPAFSMAYTTPGSYKVTLQATNSFGCTAISGQVVVVEEKQVTGVATIANAGIAIHAYGQTVEVNFNGTATAEGSTISLYNILGQTLTTVPVNGANKYILQAPVTTDGYVLVKVQSKQKQVVKKVFLYADK